MAAQALRAKQAPLKDAYKSDPQSAVITLSQSGTLDSTSISCKLDTGKQISEAQKKVAGLHPKCGGEDPEISGELCSGDMLLEALTACSGVTLKAVATALDVKLRSGRVVAEGDLDFKGTLGIDKAAPVGFTAIRLMFDLELEPDDQSDDEKIEKLGKLTERYCVVWQTLVNPSKLDMSVRLQARQQTEQGIERTTGWGHKCT